MKVRNIVRNIKQRVQSQSPQTQSPQSQSPQSQSPQTQSPQSQSQSPMQTYDSGVGLGDWFGDCLSSPSIGQGASAQPFGPFEPFEPFDGLYSFVDEPIAVSGPAGGFHDALLAMEGDIVDFNEGDAFAIIRDLERQHGGVLGTTTFLDELREHGALDFDDAHLRIIFVGIFDKAMKDVPDGFDRKVMCDAKASFQREGGSPVLNACANDFVNLAQTNMQVWGDVCSPAVMKLIGSCCAALISTADAAENGTGHRYPSVQSIA